MGKQAPDTLSPHPEKSQTLRLVGLFSVAALLFAASVSVPTRELSAILIASGGALVWIGAAALAGFVFRRQALQKAVRRIAHVVEDDITPCFLTDPEGAVVYRNDAAASRFDQPAEGTLVDVMSGLFAAPNAVIPRLCNKTMLHDNAREEVALRRGTMRLSTTRIGSDLVLWRFEEFGDRGVAARGSEGISLPMLTVSGSGTVLHINDALRRLIGGREPALDRIINDLPLRPGGVHEVATLDGPMRTTILEVSSAAGRREIYFLPVPPDQGPSDRGLIEALPVPLLRLSPDGSVLMANAGARELVHLEPGEVPTLAGLIDGLGRPVTDWLAEATSGRGLNRPEFVKANHPDRDVYLQISLGRVEDEQGISLLAVLNDETELKTLEAQFVQSQKMQAIGQLAGGVAHDFNNLLTAISGHCDLLLLRHDEGDPDYADLEQINQNANRAASLVGQLLAFSRKQNLQPRILDLRDCLSELTHLLSRLVGEKTELDVRHGTDLKRVRADKRQLEQVIMNLVVNARDAMPDGGTIRIETSFERLQLPLERDRAKVPPGDYVVVSVTDEGSGIAADKLPKIFEPFFTTKRAGEGTGLGLSTAYGIVKQTGGYIFADSAIGRGSRFSIYLPAYDSADEKEGPDAPPMKARPVMEQAGGVVLLVEDEAPVRAFASRALRLRGYTVLEAANAEEALEALEDRELNVDVFVTDVVMPGMDGPSWVSKALEFRPDTRVVFVSGYAEDHLADSQAKIPNSIFLPKPFSLNDLTDTVHRQMH